MTTSRSDRSMRGALPGAVRRGALPGAVQRGALPGAVAGLAYGGDYNPEQWPREVWAQDVALMRQAGVTLVTVGVFSWALLEPSPGRHDFGWLDEVMDLMAQAGIAVDLATATASPPPWLAARHPETLPETADGTRLWPGGRQAWCPSSPVFRSHALALVEKVAARYAEHPALAMWHVSNELGCHNVHCFCDVSAEAFRRWLQQRYGDLEALNSAWGTTFWSQHYSDWTEIQPPRSAPTFPNPTQQLDFRRFSSDELLAHHRAEREVLTRLTPGVPVTTNFMVMSHVKDMDYFAWAGEVDIVSTDHYVDAADPCAHVELAFSADWTRGIAGGAPWLLMEHSTSAVNWQPRNRAKAPGEMVRNSLAHVARGSEGAMFFQWRASRAGAEKFHSAMVPHVGTDSKTWREVVTLGRHLGALGEVRGSVVRADVAMVLDYEAWWACELDSHPSVDVTYLDQARALYRALWDLGVTVDMVRAGSSLEGYRLALVPTLYLCTDAAAAEVERHVQTGGTALVTCFSGIVDENDHVRLGGYPGAFRSLLGLRTEEFFPLQQGESVALDDGSRGTVWTELVHLDGAQAMACFADGSLTGHPALTRHTVGDGAAWYAATRLDEAGTTALVRRLLAEAGVTGEVEGPPTLEAVRRHAADGTSYLFLLNHDHAAVTVDARGVGLLGSPPAGGSVTVPGGGVVVLREGS